MNTTSKIVSIQPSKRLRFQDAISKYKFFYIMLIPGILYIIMFSYIPMTNLVIAFQDFKIFKGVLGSKWVGFDNFIRLFQSAAFYELMRNTLVISLSKIILGFPVPILLALFLNEVRSTVFKRSVQTIIYLPHFLSWVVVAALATTILSPTDGFLNSIIRSFGGEPIMFLGESKYFRQILIITDMWKESGWSAIIYLAALTGVPQEHYEAASIDGANRLQKILSVSFPFILPTIIIMLLLRVGGILNAGFEQVFAMYNSAVYDVADIIDTYVYRIGIIDTKYGFTTAVGLFKSVIACFMVVSCNKLSKKLGQESLF